MLWIPEIKRMIKLYVKATEDIALIVNFSITLQFQKTYL